MADRTVNFIINIVGNAKKMASEISSKVGEMTRQTDKFSQMINSLGAKSLVFNQISQSLQQMSAGLNSVIKPGIAFDKSLSELSAITGVTGEGLNKIGAMAKDVARTFGTDAAQGVESFKLLLSQLSPDLGNTPEVMKKMGEDIATLSKTMGGDTTAAAEVLTTAMNQFGISMADPIKAEKEMARMMNVMAAAAKEGSAELPQIQEALKNSGMVAKTANVSFEETTAAIEVLDKAGRKGAEGGTALRNVLSVLGKGKYLPKDTLTELQAAGVNIGVLTDKSKSLKQRLEALKPVMTDQALLTKTFGLGNAASAIALIQNTELLGEYTQAVTGTNTAVEQAAIIMDNYEERQNRMRAKLDEVKISIFEATAGFSGWLSIIGETLIPLSQLTPLLSGVIKVIPKIGTAFTVAAGVIKVACRGIGAAITSIPIIGWIALAVSAIAGLVAYFWNTSAKFRATVKGSWAYVVSITKEAWEVLKKIFSALGDMIKAAVTLDFNGVKAAAKKLTTTFADFGRKSAKAYNDAYNEEIEKSKKAEAKERATQKSGTAKSTVQPVAEDNAETSEIPVQTGAVGLGKGTGGTSSEGIKNSVRNITTTIQNLINGDIVIHTTNIRESASEIKRVVIEALQNATNEYAFVE